MAIKVYAVFGTETHSKPDVRILINPVKSLEYVALVEVKKLCG